MNEIIKNLSKVLKTVRIAHGLTQKEASKKIGISAGYLCELEYGKKTITLSILIRFAELFQIEAYRLLWISSTANFKKWNGSLNSLALLDEKTLTLLQVRT